MDDETRARFHEQANTTHRLEARVLVLEGDVEVLAKDVEHAATIQQFNSLSQLIELKMQMMSAASLAASSALKEEIAPLKRAVYGLLAIIVVAVVGAMVSGVLK